MPVADTAGRAHRVQLNVTIAGSTMTQLGRQSFHVAAATVWNSLQTHCSTSISSETDWRLITSHRPIRLNLWKRFSLRVYNLWTLNLNSAASRLWLIAWICDRWCSSPFVQIHSTNQTTINHYHKSELRNILRVSKKRKDTTYRCPATSVNSHIVVTCITAYFSVYYYTTK